MNTNVSDEDFQPLYQPNGYNVMDIVRKNGETVRELVKRTINEVQTHVLSNVDKMTESQRADLVAILNEPIT